MIHLGYETGTGKPVAIPLAHMAVTGLTQKSGKTVTMESLIDRGDLRAVVFVTKPGEKSFTKGRKILPFFKERADWEYVKELLEARRNESLSKWDGYLMRVCKHAKTLQQVRDNIEDELPNRKSVRPSHYEVLGGYLDLLIPELWRVDYTDKLVLEHGVNIMDLTGLSDDMQSLVIRSTIEHIHKRERNTVLVMPEAWKFIPEGGRSAVFQALQALVREGATNGNFVWIDAQDLAIVSKRILKSVSVWVLGKQQEANEVARTINHLIEPLHIRPDVIKSLGIGQFLVCGEGVTKKVYVQPWWLGELDALAIAKGEESVETAQAIFRQKKRELAARPAFSSAIPALRHVFPLGEEPPEAKRQGGRKTSEAPMLKQILSQEEPERVQNEERLPEPAVAVATGRETEDRTIGTGIADGHVAADSDSEITDGRDEAMWKEKFEELFQTHQTLIEAHDALAREVKRLQESMLLLDEHSRGASDIAIRRPAALVAAGLDPVDVPSGPQSAGNGKLVTHTQPFTVLSESQEKIYRYIIRRAEEDPRLLKILTTERELLVHIETPVLEVNGATLKGGLALLIHKGFFATPKSGKTVFNELQRLGRRTAKRNVYRELDGLAELGFLTKEGGGYRATELKVSVKR
jgi:hypothetical protein